MFKKILAAAILLLPVVISSAQTPRPDHVVVVVLENTSYGSVLSSGAAPYLSSLANDTSNAVFQNSFAITHPSQPNYLALYSGSVQGVSNDNLPVGIPFKTPNLGAEMLKNGYSFAGYSEGLPSVGSTVEYYGTYARKHSPWINWQNSSSNGVPASSNLPFSSFPRDFYQLPTLSFVIPTLDHDMHDPAHTSTAIRNGDAWLKANLSAYADWAKFHNSLLIITWDEDDNNQNNQILTLFLGQSVKGGNYAQKIDHYNVLRTICDMFKITAMGKAATASDIGNIWKPMSTTNVCNTIQQPAGNMIVFPNPAIGHIKMNFKTAFKQDVKIELVDAAGRTIERKTLNVEPGDNNLEIGEGKDLSKGMYLVSLEESGKNTIVKKVIVE